ncbi:MAG: alkaline phosphatase family protein [Deltaproteobacteria bacterium]|nr:alkaline phosphatase family protein [Deltaproteobacteria bacterium]
MSSPLRASTLALGLLGTFACGSEGASLPVDTVSSTTANGGAGGVSVASAGGAANAGGFGGMPATGSGGAGGVGGGSGGSMPDVLSHLSLAMRTGSGPNDGTDKNELALCLTSTDCFPLNVADVNDFRVGELDVYHFDDVDLPLAAIDRVELRSQNGTDRYRPACLEIQFDGKPVYCEDGLDVALGSEGGIEVESYLDPLGLHLACVTCYPEPVTHGPLVGAVTPTSARVMVRADATRKLNLRLKKKGAAGQAAIVATELPSPHTDFTAHFDLAGLEAGTAYELSLDVDGVPSTKGTGSFVTPSPAATHPPLRLAFGSCARLWDQPIFDSIAAVTPDLFLFVGDNHYGNTPDVGGLRWNYRRALEVPERAALLATTPTLAVWDDHDYVGNNTLGSSPGKENALRVFKEYWANATYGVAGTPGVFSTYRWGDVELFLLDDRYYRSPESDPKGTMLGSGQTKWLEDALLASTATFKLLVTGSMWSAHGGETWADFPGARTALLDLIRDKAIGGVVLLAGDVHRSELRKLRRKAAGAYDLPEIVSSALANPGGTCPASSEPDAQTVACFDAGDHFATLDFDTKAADPKLTARLRDVKGATLATMVVLRSSLK